MAERLQQLKLKYEALSQREKVLVLLSTFVAVIVIWFLLFSDPMLMKTQQAGKQRDAMANEIAGLKQQYQALLQRRNDDPNREIKQRIAQLDTFLEKANTELRDKFHGLVEPKQMAQVLESVVRQHRDLKLIRVRSLDAVPLITRKPDQDGESSDDTQPQDKQVDVYRHGMQVEFEGNFIATLDYLKALEALDWEFYWDAVQLEVMDYPRSHIVITVHTLSLNDAWIGV